ncbi:MAG: 16S rRNA (guanine(527)-N(7))-methyltransferase RsmG [Anaerolineae bacterium]|nr:16S rRNA (guanine(527)-N(7))-methyltransferase RsmG [Anaerolineae bacterium]
MDKLLRATHELKLPVREQHLPLFRRYYELLLEWNERFNLTAVTDEELVQVRHFADSLTCLLATPALMAAAQKGSTCRLVDVGAGAGFPGLPIKIIWPQSALTLLESVGKKCAFLAEVASDLGLTGVEVVNARAEEAGQDAAHRERYDVVLARAVADLPVLAEYCLPLARLQGLVIAQKGDDVAEEVVRAEHAVRLLGGAVERVQSVEVPGTALPRTLVVIRKESLTPAQYPRRPGVPARRPLREH